MNGLWIGSYFTDKAEGERFELPLEVGTQAMAIMAKREAGKSYTAGVLEEELAKHQFPFIVLDPVGVHWGLRSSADGEHESPYPVVVVGGDHGDLPIEKGQGAALADAVIEDNFSVIIDLTGLSKGAWRIFVRDFCRRLYEKNRTPRHVIVEEASEFIPQVRRPDMQEIYEAVERLVALGRNRGIGVTVVDRRSAQVAKDVLSQVDVLIALRTVSPHDRKALVDTLEGSMEERHLSMVEVFKREISSLQNGEAFVWAPKMGVFDLIKIRARETFHAGATPTFELPDVVQARPDVTALAARLEPPPVENMGISTHDSPGEVKALREKVADLTEVNARLGGEIASARDALKEAQEAVQQAKVEVARAQEEAAAARALRVAFTRLLGNHEVATSASPATVDMEELVRAVAAHLPATNGSGPKVTLAAPDALRKKYLDEAVGRVYERIKAIEPTSVRVFEVLLSKDIFWSVSAVAAVLWGVGADGKPHGGNRDRAGKALGQLVDLGLVQKGGQGRGEYKAAIALGIRKDLAAHSPTDQEVAQVEAHVLHRLAAGVS